MHSSGEEVYMSQSNSAHGCHLGFRLTQQLTWVHLQTKVFFKFASTFTCEPVSNTNSSLKTYPTHFQYLMVPSHILHCPICVWSRLTCKAWSEFEGEIIFFKYNYISIAGSLEYFFFKYLLTFVPPYVFICAYLNKHIPMMLHAIYKRTICISMTIPNKFPHCSQC